MTISHRRDFLRTLANGVGAGFAMTTFPPVIQKALAIGPSRDTGTLDDVKHIVILMQENRSFDHYFGTLAGVRGFGDRFPIPVPDAPGIRNKTVWYQSNGGITAGPNVIVPFRLNTVQNFDVMRVTGTPHTWPNAQQAWGDGKLNEWPRYKGDHAMGYFTEEDIPFQFALAEAFTLCDAYHCSFHGGTNPNRLFLWSGTNDPLGEGQGPALTNDYDNLEHDADGGYTWVTYSERLEQAGVTWQVYQNMADNFTDNPLAGFRSFRDAVLGKPGALAALARRGLSTRDLDLLRQDVLDGTLPQVSWIVATAEGSEHPGPSSPAQGADYTARVLEALTADPELWSKTVLIVNFDENDGFFDHVPPPAVPTYVAGSELGGASSVDTTGEYHELLPPDVDAEGKALLHKPYGLGPRVPLYVISPWSRGGWVNSEVFDHTSVIRFVEKRFGVFEPNITPWRRTVAGDLTSAFDFGDPNDEEFFEGLPDTIELADRARALPGTTTPPTPALLELPVQSSGTRPSRALPYELHVRAKIHARADQIRLTFVNAGAAGAVFHVYDRLHLDAAPRRFTVEVGRHLAGIWEASGDAGAYDLWVLGPNGFHRHFIGNTRALLEHRAVQPEVELGYEGGDLCVRLNNGGARACRFELTPNAYANDGRRTLVVGPHAELEHRLSLRNSGHWYDFSVEVDHLGGYLRRFAGRVETGRHSISDPALGGRALGER